MINDYLNLIEFLKLALMFYANEDNYVSTITTESMINIDKGHNARFALEQIGIVKEINEKIDDNILKAISEMEKDESDNINTIMALINKEK